MVTDMHGELEKEGILLCRLRLKERCLCLHIDQWKDVLCVITMALHFLLYRWQQFSDSRSIDLEAQGVKEDRSG